MAVVLYPRLTRSDKVQVWIGVDASVPPQLAWTLNGAPAVPRAVRAIAPARPAALTHPNELRVFTGLYEFDGQPATTYRIGAGTNLGSTLRVVRTPPDKVPQFPAALRMLLISCYHRAEDKVGAAMAIAQAVKAQPPDLALFAGDQVYLDLPTLRNFEDDEAWLARKFEKEDYGPNWMGMGGLSTALAAAPAVFTPDDHEYWNNAPHSAPHIQSSWTADGRRRWRNAARVLWEAFQQTGDHAVADAIRHDIEPLAILVLDTRSARTEDKSRTMTNAARAALDAWSADVIRKKWLGVLVNGQSIFQSPEGGLSGAVGDWHLSNYGDYAAIVKALQAIVDAGRSVLTLTGDVHWGRVLWGKHIGRPYAVGEVISSPLSLVTDVLSDTAGRWWRQLTGTGDPLWPRHEDAPDDANASYPAKFFGNAYDFRREYGQKGDQFTTLSFARIAPQTVDLSVTFHSARVTQPPMTRGPFRLQL